MPPDISCGYDENRFSASGIFTAFSNATAVSRASDLDMSRWKRSDSVIWLPIFMTGFSAVIGSWKIMAISSPHSSRYCESLRPEISVPSKNTCPERIVVERGSRPMIDRDSTDLPEPDSPTMPSVLPRSRLKETPLTALRTPRSVTNWVVTSRTSSSVAAPGVPLGTPPPSRMVWGLTARTP